MNAHNSGGLAIACVVTASLMVLLSTYQIEGMQHAKSIYYIFAGIQILVFIYCLVTAAKKNKASTFRINLGIILFALNLLCFSIYVCVLDHGIYNVRFLLFFLSFEVIFILDILFNLLVNVGIVLIFSFVYIFADQIFGVKPPETYHYDIINVIATSIITMTFNGYISYAFIKGFINSYSLQEERNQYHDESIHDQLTGLSNRRSFEQSVGFFTSVCRHVHQTVCVLMMDVDFFKKYNDYYGHQKGDEVLIAIGGVLENLVKNDRVFAARVGGEEFIVLWTENRIIEAQRLALKLRHMIIDLQIPHRESDVAPYVTASFGLYIMRGGRDDEPKDLYNAADSALYKAKESGRDCIVMFDSEDKAFTKIDITHPNELPLR